MARGRISINKRYVKKDLTENATVILGVLGITIYGGRFRCWVADAAKMAKAGTCGGVGL